MTQPDESFNALLGPPAKSVAVFDDGDDGRAIAAAPKPATFDHGAWNAKRFPPTARLWRIAMRVRRCASLSTGKAGWSALWRVLGGLESVGQAFLIDFESIAIKHHMRLTYVENINLDSPMKGAIMGLDGKFGNLGRNISHALLTEELPIGSNVRDTES